VNQIADTKEFGTVFFSEKVTANILSFVELEQSMEVDQVKRIERKCSYTAGFRVTSRSDKSRSYLFRRHGQRGCLFVYEGEKYCGEAKAFVTTVKEKMAHLRPQDRSGAQKALMYKQRLNFPTSRVLKKMLVAGTFPDAEITTRDVDNCDYVFGKTRAEAAGKSVYEPTSPEDPVDILDEAADFVQKLKSNDITLHSDIMFVDGLPFLVSVSEWVGYTTISYLRARNWPTILKAIEEQKNVYSKHGWNVKGIKFDREKGVEAIRSVLATKLGLHLDTSATAQHQPKIERRIRFVKERIRCELANLGYNVNRNFLVYIPSYVVRKINLSMSNIIGVNMSPKEILTGTKASAKVETRVGFGEHCLVWKKASATNSTEKRAVSCICLGLSNNSTSSGIFFDLSKPLKQTPMVADNYDISPMPEDVVWKLNELAKEKPVKSDLQFFDDEMPLPATYVEPSTYTNTTRTAEDVLTEADVPGPLGPVSDDFVMAEEASLEELLDDPVKPPSVDDEAAHQQTDDGLRGDVGTTDDVPQVNEGIDASHDGSGMVDVRGDVSNDIDIDVRGDVSNDIDIDVIDVGTAPAETSTAAPAGRTLRSHSGISKRKVYMCVSKVEASNVLDATSYHISLKKGLSLYGEQAKSSVRKEVEAMIEKDVFEPLDARNLSYKQKRSAIRSFMFLKEKFKADGSFDKLKSRLTANGKTQCRAEVEAMFGSTSSPTISMSSLMTVLSIAKSEGRHLATVDIKNAYLNASLEDEGLIVVLDEAVAKEYLKLVPGAEDKLSIKGELFCKLNKALYGTVEGAKAWYDNLSNFLMKDLKFEVNSYDNCVFNRVINGVQITVGLYVDDLLITCRDKRYIKDLNEKLTERYKETTFHDDLSLSYLGMIIDNSNKDYIEIKMPAFVQQVIDESGVDKSKVSDIPASAGLFTVDESATLLDDEAREDFHSLVAKLLYLSKRGRPDILLPVTFLCTRVSSPSTDDKKKLSKVIKYLNGTKDMGLKIRKSEEALDICVYCDASFAVHPNMRSHTGAIVEVGKTPVFFKSTKQKLNAKSSTEAEVIALSDILPQALQTAYFLEEQMEQKVKPKFYEDNQSAIAMLKNGRPIAEATRHINIRYFFISDYLKQGKIDIEYINTSEQVGDFYTKPLTGAEFIRHRDRIMGYEGQSRSSKGAVKPRGSLVVRTSG